MADSKISLLTELDAIPADDDEVAIVDTSEGNTVKMTAANLRAVPMVILSKSSTVSQNVGGANGTVAYWTWDGQTKIDSMFTHSTVTNSERVTINTTGWYEIIFRGSAQQTGSARTTLEGLYRIDAGTAIAGGTFKNYSRGASYGNISAGIHTIIQITAASYIEVGTRVEDSDGTYTITASSGAEVLEEESVLIIKRVA